MSTGETSPMSAAPAAAPQEEPGAKKFGVVLFDDEKDPQAAWVAVNGSEAKRIQGMNELPTDTIYLTNMSYESFYKETKAWMNPWLRHDAYLVVKPKDVLAEWGNDPANTPPNWTAQFASVVFGRIMMMAYRLAKECDPKVTLAKLFTGKTLREDLRRLLPKAEFPTGAAATIMRSGQIYAEFTRTTVRGVRGARVVVLRRPRISYAFEMLTTPVPKGPFEFKSRADLRAVAPDRVAWVRRVDRPCLIEIAVQQMEADVAPIYGFGNSTDKDKRIARSWVAHPEFIVMANFSDLEVKSAYVGKEYTLINTGLPEPVKRFLGDKFTELSWSAGVIAETLWRAAALGQEKGGPSVAPEERAHTSWRGAWLKAADKASMFTSAMKLTELGYPAVSYGLGWVSCLVTEDQVQNLMLDGLTVGLVPKLQEVPESLFSPNQAIPWGGDKRSQMLAQLTMMHEKNMLWNLDKLPLFERNQREVMLKRMHEARKSQRL